MPTLLTCAAIAFVSALIASRLTWRRCAKAVRAAADVGLPLVVGGRAFFVIDTAVANEAVAERREIERRSTPTRFRGETTG